jgi:putative endonuclease
MNNNEYGLYGENLASKYLKKNKYRIAERNFECFAGEIDIIAYDKKTLVFVEVKSRQNERFGLPREAVGYYKQRVYSKAALHYITVNRLFKLDARFDVIEILNGEINHIKNAFDFIRA